MLSMLETSSLHIKVFNYLDQMIGTFFGKSVSPLPQNALHHIAHNNGIKFMPQE